MKVIKMLWEDFLLITIAILMVILSIFCIAYEEIKYTKYYEYIDLDNNEGIAKECSYKFKEYRRGGQGSPVCELEDGTIIQVKQYKMIRVENK